MNNDFSGGVDVPEKRTAYAFTNFFEDTEDIFPPSSAQEYTGDCRYSTRINRHYSRLHSVDQRFTVNNQKQQRDSHRLGWTKTIIHSLSLSLLSAS